MQPTFGQDDVGVDRRLPELRGVCGAGWWSNASGLGKPGTQDKSSGRTGCALLDMRPDKGPLLGCSSWLASLVFSLFTLLLVFLRASS